MRGRPALRRFNTLISWHWKIVFNPLLAPIKFFVRPQGLNLPALPTCNLLPQNVIIALWSWNGDSQAMTEHYNGKLKPKGYLFKISASNMCRGIYKKVVRKDFMQFALKKFDEKPKEISIIPVRFSYFNNINVERFMFHIYNIRLLWPHLEKDKTFNLKSNNWFFFFRNN